MRGGNTPVLETVESQWREVLLQTLVCAENRKGRFLTHRKHTYYVITIYYTFYMLTFVMCHHVCFVQATCRSRHTHKHTHTLTQTQTGA